MHWGRMKGRTSDGHPICERCRRGGESFIVGSYIVVRSREDRGQRRQTMRCPTVTSEVNVVRVRQPTRLVETMMTASSFRPLRFA